MELMKGRISLAPISPEKKWAALPIFLTSLIFFFVLLTSLNMGLLASLSALHAVLFSREAVETHPSSVFTVPAQASPPPPTAPSLGFGVPRFAYFISGSKGDLDQLWRTLHAIYHPRNIYLLHLDLESPRAERSELAGRVARHPLFSGNVHVIAKANMVTYLGPTMVANTLHASAILLKKSMEWDWFINLSASDYPLVTQDDLLFAFSKLPKNLSFVEHTSRLGWKEAERGKPMIVDPGLYKTTKSRVFWVWPKRELPSAFKLFTGSAWMVLSREFVEYSVWGWDNLPRILLMYYSNFVSSPEGYFHTLICNSPEFAATAVNHDLHHIAWDYPPKQHPHILSVNDTAKLIGSHAAFARKFRKDDQVLDFIDQKLLRRSKDGFAAGGWRSGDDGELKPGPGARRLMRLMDRVVRSEAFRKNQCV
ncbi:hypothetical protein AXF42_Ash005278 [Apostasia shenzhenica]|uniref:Xylosyltransferase 2 n=1 Tax=Apostasia shenzhenica TaxID=1088818 RepID=A0A2I0B6F9_9ASPA|nr:hypothetical protein AXF42_Ash005278 [Apostasia shenzhenica]